MTETVVKNEICPTCGTELPATAEFCYHCGNPVKSEISSGNDNEISDAWLRGDISQNSNENNRPEKIKVRSIRTATQQKNLEKDLGDFQQKTGNSKLKSAASLKVKAKKLPQKKIEIRWEEYDDTPNIWFIGGAILLTIAAFIIFILAMYLR